jgi:carbon storage regulator CsrA
MLVLSRNLGEKLVINDDLIITIVKVHLMNGRYQVHMSFDGTKEKYHIVRSELIDPLAKMTPHG